MISILLFYSSSSIFWRLWGLFREHQPQFVSPSCSTFFFISLSISNYLLSFILFFISQLPWLLIVFIILSYGLFGSRVFQLADNLAKIFEKKCESNWKVQVSTLATITGRLNVNKMDSCIVTGLIGDMKKSEFGTCVRGRYILVIWHHTNDIQI